MIEMARLCDYARVTQTFWQESSSSEDFRALMQVRLSLSKVGRWACPSPRMTRVSLRSLGNDVWLRSHSSDISVLSELLVSRQYGVVSGIRRGQVRAIVDLGANTGLAARWLMHKYPAARIVAVEPERGNLEVLRRNLASDRVKIVPACIGSREREVALTTGTGAWGYHMVEADSKTRSADRVPVVTMDTVLSSAAMDSVDLLKCDIEGAERELFENCASWIQRVGAAIIECHDGLTGPGLLGLIRDNGAVFDIVYRDVDDRHGHETVMIVRRTTPGASPGVRRTN